MNKLRIFGCLISILTCVFAFGEHAVVRTETDTDIIYTDGITTAKRNKTSNAYEVTIRITLASGVYENRVAAQVAQSHFDDIEEKYLEQQEASEAQSDREPDEVEEEIDYMEQLFNKDGND
jgi:hypothetical protein